MNCFRNAFGKKECFKIFLVAVSGNICNVTMDTTNMINTTLLTNVFKDITLI